MENGNSAQKSALSARWSSRLLILTVLGILFLTLFPFRFVPHARVPSNRSPLLLGGRGKDPSGRNVLLNVLLFVPLGFALSAKLRERGWSYRAILGCSVLISVLLSYTIEFLQLYTAGRDSGWEDILTNGAGAILGSAVFLVCGDAILWRLSKGHELLTEFLTPRRAAAVIAIYFAAWLSISALVQMQTRLGNWHSDDLLLVGNNAGGSAAVGDPHAWKGKIFSLQLWNRALSRRSVRSLGSSGAGSDLQTGLLASYDFSTPGSFRAQQNFLPGLSWFPASPSGADPPYLRLDGRSWLTSRASVTDLVTAAQSTNQFTLRILFQPAELVGIDAPIVSLSAHRPNVADFEIAQQNTTLTLRLRNSLCGDRSPFVWMEHSAINTNRPLDLLFSYDGATASLDLSGVLSRTYRLGPGAVVGRLVHDVRPSALDLYACGYYFVIFFAGGALSGTAGRNLRSMPLRACFLALCIVMPAFVLEMDLAGVSGRPFSWLILVSSIGVGAAGAVWINAGVSPRIVE